MSPFRSNPVGMTTVFVCQRQLRKHPLRDLVGGVPYGWRHTEKEAPSEGLGEQRRLLNLPKQGQSLQRHSARTRATQ